ncbi:transcriptional regulator [Sphaerisporangium siamense]|uniref:Transcriptional regulator with XRE-family HTH domain n=1 Tax=Sphaerisporangium siamense TaxID=795645 RepID=A0A7W7DDD4_9ACTN|nr:helix-turn-helix transcriptional regulator [Sphaerisporangium siamense]MBB4704759.1 transcriptional regulator with XRE-family HTH domain [Sphaerisporangium siamense]GII88742.1 transcriptional regulator [Sphaerisporangium siamense]
MKDEPVCDPGSPIWRFGAELRRLREEAGLSQEAMAARLQITQTHVSRLELGKRMPQQCQAETLDRLFGLTDEKYFVGLRQRITARPSGPGWYMRWVEEVEPEALILRSWDPLLIPGLLQTEAYARSIFLGTPDTVPRDVEGQVGARMRRKDILEREKPPAIWALIDEWVLRRPMGGEAVLCEQLDYLIEVSGRHNVNIQLVPGDACCPAGLSSGFVIAQLGDGAVVVSVESAGRGEVSVDRELVAHIWGAYDRIRAEAYTAAISLKMMKDARDRWNQRT